MEARAGRAELFDAAARIPSALLSEEAMVGRNSPCVEARAVRAEWFDAAARTPAVLLIRWKRW